MASEELAEPGGSHPEEIDPRDLPPEVQRLLRAATALQDAEPLSAPRAALRLEAYYSGLWQVVSPPIFAEELSVSLQAVVDARQAGDEQPLEGVLGSIDEALALLEPTDIPLRAQLHSEAAEAYLRHHRGPLSHVSRCRALEHAAAALGLLSATSLVPSVEAAERCTVLADTFRALGSDSHRRQVVQSSLLAMRIAPDGEDEASKAFALMLRHNYALCLLDSADPNAPAEAEAEFCLLVDAYTATMGKSHPLTASVVASLIRATQHNGGLARIEECVHLGESYVAAGLLKSPQRARPEHANLFAALCDVYVDRQVGDPRANLERAIVLSTAATEILRRRPERFRELAMLLRLRASLERFTDTVSGQSTKAAAVRHARESFRLLHPDERAPLSYEAAVSADELANCLMIDPFTEDEARSALAYHSLALGALNRQDPRGAESTFNVRLDLLLTKHQILFRELCYDGYLVPPGSLDAVIEEFRALIADASANPAGADIIVAATSHLAQSILESRVDEASIREAVALGWASMRPHERSRQSRINRTEAYLIGTLLAERGYWAEAGEFFREAVRRFRDHNRSLLSVESRMADARDGAGLSLRAAYCLSRAGRVQEAASALEASMDLWLHDVRGRSGYLSARLELASPDLWHRYVELEDRLAYLQALEIDSGRPWTVPAAKTEFGDAQRRIQRELEALRIEFASLADQIRKIPGLETFSFTDESPVDLRVLGLDRPVVYLGVSAWGGVAIILDGAGPADVVLDSTFEHDDMARFLAAQSSGGGGYSEGQLGDEPQLVHALSKLSTVAPRLVDELGDRLVERASAAILIPSGAMSLMPIHAMGSVPLGDRVSISYLTSVSSLSHPARGGSAELDEPELDYLGIVGDRSGLRDEHGSIELRAASHFPQSRVELLGSETSAEDAVVSMRSAGVVHFVGHGQFLLGEPHLAAIQFQDGSSLRFVDIYRSMDLRHSQLVVISACKTAVRARVPAESISVATSFLTAGARCTIGTLWEANDLASTLLVSRFFDVHFGAGGSDFAVSLREAQRWLRSSTRSELVSFWENRDLGAAPRTLTRERPLDCPFADPIYWAPYVVLGNPTAVRRAGLEA